MEESVRHKMLLWYAKLPYQPHLVNMYRQYFEVLACNSGPVLVCCDDGKSRTGLLAALVQSVLGMHWDDILEDYLFSNKLGTESARIADAAGGLTMQPTHRGSLLLNSVRTSAETSLLASAFDSIRDNHGGIDLYCREVLGMTPALKDRLIGNLMS